MSKKPLIKAALMCVILLLIPFSVLPWESQLFPFNGGTGKYQITPVSYNSRTWELLDYSYVGYRLSEVALATGVPCNIQTVTATGDIAADLQAKLNTVGLAGGGIVRIPAGNFTLSVPVGINYPNVSVEGAGRGRTIINVPSTHVYSDDANAFEGAFTFEKNIWAWNKSWYNGGTQLCTITNTINEGDTYITGVSNLSALNVGDYVTIIQYFWAALVSNNAAATWQSGDPTADRQYSFGYLRKIIAKDGLGITIDAPIPWTLNPANNTIHVYRSGPAQNMLQNVGISGMSIIFEDNNNGASARPSGCAINFEGVIDGWVKDVYIGNFPRYGIYLDYSARITILDTEIDLCQDFGGSGYGYGLFVNCSQNILAKRCKVSDSRHNFIISRAPSHYIVFSQCDSFNAELGEDTHYSLSHAVLRDKYTQRNGNAIDGFNRGSDSSGAYESFGTGAIWNFYGDHYGGVYNNQRSINITPSQDGYAILVGVAGLHEVYDGSHYMDDGSTYVKGTIVANSAGFQVGPAGNRQNVLYEGVGFQAGLQPDSLYEEQLKNRIGTAPADWANPCSEAATATPVATATKILTPGQLIYNGDSYGWGRGYGGANPTPLNTLTPGPNFHDEGYNKTVAGKISFRIQPGGSSGGVIAAFGGPDLNTSAYTTVEGWVYPQDSNLSFTVRLFNNTTGVGSGVTVDAARADGGAWNLNQWNHFSAAISLFGYSGTFNGIVLSNTAITPGKTFWLDDFYMIGPAPATDTPTETVTNTRTNTLTSTPTATATRTSTATNTPTSTPTTPAGAWSSHSQVQNFDTASGYWYLQATNGSQTNVIDTADKAEGTGSIRINYTFNAGAGEVQFLSNYNLTTQDWSFMPYGVSIAVKGSGTSDTFRILLFEDHDMDGLYQEAGDEIWYYDNASVLSSSSWTALTIPFSSFVLFGANGGNGAIDLNRIRAWDIRITSSGAAHSGTVRIDDLQKLSTYSIPNNNALLSGSFFQLWNSAGCYCGGWTQAQWETEFQRMKDLCQDTVIIQYSVWQNSTGGEVGWYPTNLAGITTKLTALDNIMAAALNKSMKVFIGTYFNEDWNTFTKTDSAYYTALQAKEYTVIDELWTRYSSNTAFYGWYIPQEVDDLNFQSGTAKTLAINYFKDVSDYCKTKSATKPVMIASFFGRNQPADVEEQWWNDFFTTATNVDINAPQDGVGAGHAGLGLDVAQYYTAIKNACTAHGVTFGADVESFTPAWTPTDINTFKQQLWTAGAFTNFLVQFEWANMEPGLGGANLTLYNNYATYAATAGCGVSTNTPTATATGTATATLTPTRTMTATSTLTNTPTDTPTNNFTSTPSDTATRTATGTRTATNSPTDSFTPTETFTGSPVDTWTDTDTPTDTYTDTATATDTFTYTVTETFTATYTNTPTFTSTGTCCYSLTYTDTPTETTTFTATNTATETRTGTNTATTSHTPTSTATLQMLDDFEDNDFTTNNWGGDWNQWFTANSTLNTSITITAAEGNYAVYFGGTVSGTAWSTIEIDTDLNAAGTVVDLTAFSGMKAYMKGQKGTGTSLGFLIYLISTNVTDSSYWRYNYTPLAAYTPYTLDWTAFQAPGWGVGATLTRTQVLQATRRIVFMMTDLTGATTYNTGNQWYIDSLQLFANTPTNTHTPTNTATATLTPPPGSTNTFTPTQTGTATATPDYSACGVRVIAYYWPGAGYTASNIPYDKLTHIAHSFVYPNVDGTLNYGSGVPEAAMNTLAHAAGVKAIISTGGGGSYSYDYDDMALNTTARANFITNMIAFMNTYSYDGIDIDWEGPDNAAERDAMTALCTELRAAFDAGGGSMPSWEISIAVGGTSNSGQWLDYNALNNIVDYYNVMTYVMHGSWSDHAGYNAPIYNGNDTNDDASCETFMDYLLITRSIPPGMVNMGVPFYGLRFPTSENILDSCSGMCAGADEANMQLIYPLEGAGWTKHYDAASQVPYLTYDAGLGVISYEDPDSIHAKVDYALNSRNAGGVFMWHLSGDYYGGQQLLMDAMHSAALERCAVVTPTNTVPVVFSPTPTDTVSLGGLIIDDFEDGVLATNLLGGQWSDWGPAGSTVTRSLVTGAQGTYAQRMAGDVIGASGSWPAISMTTTFNAAGTATDISVPSGISMYMRTQAGTGTNVSFVITIQSNNITDYSYWRYTVTPNSAWSQYTIPWTSFTAPSWGQGSSVTRASVLANARNITWVITDATGGNANNTGSFWEIDTVAFLSAAPTSTPTNSPTMTVTPGGPTLTFTQTPTATAQAVTATPTPSRPDTLIISDTIFYPNPLDPGKNNVRFSYLINGDHVQADIKIYTAGLRLVKHITFKGSYYAGKNTFALPGASLQDLSQGIYYYRIEAKDDRGNIAKDKIRKIVILK